MKLFTQLIIILFSSLLVFLGALLMQMDGRISYGTCMVIMFAAGVLIFFWVYRSFIRPLRELKTATKKIKEGELDFTLETDSDSEMGELIRSFEEMRVRLLDSQEKQIASDNEERELIRNIAHDLKTPITTIRGYSEGLLDGVASSPEKQEKYLKTIHRKAEEMTGLIDELSFYCKVDTNRIPYTFTKLSAREFFDECAEDLGAELSGKSIEFTYEQRVSRKVRVIADPEQLNKVISNIISNSVKYLDKKPGKIRMVLTDDGDFIQCDISDNGRGVDKQDLPRIYDRFFRTDSSRNSSQGGSGIGLSIVKKIIEDHGGSIWASGGPGEGLTQHFILRKVNG